MAAPFDSDDMMKRSLFGAIFGFKKNNANSSSSSVSRSRASSIDHPDQPGPSWASQSHHQHVSVVPSVSAAPNHSTAPTTIPAPSSSGHGHADYFPPYPDHSFPGPLPLPVPPTQCPFSRGIQSYSSLAHQSHVPTTSFAHPPPPPPTTLFPPPTPFPYGGYTAPPPPPPYTPYPPQLPANYADYHRTKADIYREIVNECEEFERSTTTTPLAESSPTTPTVNSPLANSQWCAQPPQQQPINEITANFSMMDIPPTGISYHSLDHQRVASLVQQQIDVKPILGDKDAMEALVRLVVQAVKDTSTVNSTANTQSPEEILKRKRQMNNEAAARYRKRQREEKEKQHNELDTLEQRNMDLRRTVDDMEREIAVLKKYVLEQSRQAIVAKVEEESN